MLAWLRGFYDGDGYVNKTMVGNTSKDLLLEIKEVFQIKNPVRISKKAKQFYGDNGRLHTRKNFWILSLGAKLFNEMIRLSKKYNIGLKRKERFFSERLENK